MNLTYGSQGNDVKKLQKALNNAGYDLDVDGIYGTKTQAAVRDYQKKNNLTADGIAGSATQNSLYGNAQSSDKTANKPSDKPTEKPKKPKQEPKTDPYTYDPAGDAAYQAALRALEAAKSKDAPTYDDTYDREMQSLYEKIMNREAFSYDLSGDMLYRQYSDSYIRQGRLAMQHTMGQATALTGGYGSSYAQAVGQQQYDAYLQSLNDIVPDLYQMALSHYNAEGESLADQYAMLGDLRDNAYQTYQNELDAYNQHISGLQEQADTLFNRGYESWKTRQEMQTAADNEAYDRQQDAYKRQQDTYDRVVDTITTLGYIPTELLAEAGMSQAEAKKWLNYYYAQQKPTGSGGSSGGGSGKRSSGGSKKKKSDNAYQTLTGLLSGDLHPTKKRNLITAYYQSGKITKKQYNELMGKYGNATVTKPTTPTGGRGPNTNAVK